MGNFKQSPGLSMPRQEAYEEAVEEIIDIPGLSKIKKIMEKYNISYIVFDYKMNISAKRSAQYCPKWEEQKQEKLKKFVSPLINR